MYCPLCNRPISATDVKCINCGETLIKTTETSKKTASISGKAELNKRVNKALEDGPITGFIIILVSIWWPIRMFFNAWKNLKPVSISKFSHIVITWETNPKMYIFSAVVTILACVCGLFYGYRLLARRVD